MTNLSLAIFPSVQEFIKKNLPAETISEANEFLTTNEILVICNNIIFNEELNETIVYNFLKMNHYLIIDIGNNNWKWIIKKT